MLTERAKRARPRERMRARQRERVSVLGSPRGEAPRIDEEACDTFERNFILRALEKSDWNVTATARYLGIPLSTLKHKMARLDLRDLARKLRGA